MFSQQSCTQYSDVVNCAKLVSAGCVVLEYWVDTWEVRNFWTDIDVSHWCAWVKRESLVRATSKSLIISLIWGHLVRFGFPRTSSWRIPQILKGNAEEKVWAEAKEKRSGEHAIGLFVKTLSRIFLQVY